jgi:hypothetical protein
MKRQLPDFQQELYEITDFILSSDLARKALENPPFENYTNLVRDLIFEIDKLSDNCHLPEFTNHALPHICSLIETISDWGTNNGWIKRIDSHEAGYLLIAAIIHDIGMLSQDPEELGEEIFYRYPKGLADVPNWVRATHASRLKGLVLKILKNSNFIYLEKDFTDSDQLKFIIQLAKSHNFWPWKLEFSDLRYFKCLMKENNPRRAESLASILAVSDLLDEDSARCDTNVLLNHKYGTLINKAHWIRHGLTLKKPEIQKNELIIKFAQLPGLTQDIKKVYQALRNHYRLVWIYNQYLEVIDASIDAINFSKRKIVKGNLIFYKNIPEFQTNLENQLLRTFFPEALNIAKDENGRNEITKIKLEKIDLNEYKKFIGENEPYTDEEMIFDAEWGKEDISDKQKSKYRKKILQKNKILARKAYLSGDYGLTYHLSRIVLNKISSINQINTINTYDLYWCFVYLLLLENDPDVIKYSLIMTFENVTKIKIRNKEFDIKKQSSNYLDTLFSVIFHLLTKDADMNREYFEALYQLIFTKELFEYESKLLICLAFELFWHKNVRKYYLLNLWETWKTKIKKLQIGENSKEFCEFCEATLNRIILQNEILTKNNKTTINKIDKVLTDNTIVKNLAKCWFHLFRNNFEELEQAIQDLNYHIKFEDNYYLSYQGFLNAHRFECQASREVKKKKEIEYGKNELFVKQDEFSDYRLKQREKDRFEIKKSYFKDAVPGSSRYIENSSKKPFAFFNTLKESKITQLITTLDETKSSAQSTLSEIGIVQLLYEIQSLRYWDLESYKRAIDLKKLLYYAKSKVTKQIIFISNTLRLTLTSLELQENENNRTTELLHILEMNSNVSLEINKLITYSLNLHQYFNRQIRNLFSLIEDLLPERKISNIFHWIDKTFESWHHSRGFNMKYFDFLVPIISYFRIHKDSWLIINNVMDKIAENINLIRSNDELIIIFLEKAPSDLIIKYANKITTLNTNDEYFLFGIRTILINATLKRRELSLITTKFIEKLQTINPERKITYALDLLLIANNYIISPPEDKVVLYRPIADEIIDNLITYLTEIKTRKSFTESIFGCMNIHEFEFGLLDWSSYPENKLLELLFLIDQAIYGCNIDKFEIKGLLAVIYQILKTSSQDLNLKFILYLNKWVDEIPGFNKNQNHSSFVQIHSIILILCRLYQLGTTKEKLNFRKFIFQECIDLNEINIHNLAFLLINIITSNDTEDRNECFNALMLLFAGARERKDKIIDGFLTFLDSKFIDENTNGIEKFNKLKCHDKELLEKIIFSNVEFCSKQSDPDSRMTSAKFIAKWEKHFTLPEDLLEIKKKLKNDPRARVRNQFNNEGSDDFI